jgi:hypothetical protein
MQSWPILKCDVDLKGSYTNFHDKIWSNMCNRTDDRGWCNDLIWGDLYIVRDVKECSHYLFWSARWIGIILQEASTTNLRY